MNARHCASQLSAMIWHASADEMDCVSTRVMAERSPARRAASAPASALHAPHAAGAVSGGSAAPYAAINASYCGRVSATVKLCGAGGREECREKGGKRRERGGARRLGNARALVLPACAPASATTALTLTP
jgi:hypothetical protein